jgi:hypothetical protein
VNIDLHAGFEAHFAALKTFLDEQEICFEPEVHPLLRGVLAHPGKDYVPF